ncbi:MAG: hypothetical protein RLZZ524_1597 [Pseudomonadota bacterium]
MIRLKPSPTFRFRVELAVPGSEDRAKFTLIGKHQGQSALKAWAEKAGEMEGKDVVFLSSAIAGWEDVTDDEGKPVVWNEQNFGALIDAYPGAGLAIFQAYIRELSAGRTKN